MNPIEVLINNEEAWKTIDHRVDGWPFMSSMWPVCVLIILAFAMVLYGPIYMRTRKPLNIGSIMAFFNIFIVAFNLYIACQLWIGGSRKQYSWICQANDSTATDIEEMRIVEAMYLWFISKLMEMFDSFFLIAIKKGRNSMFFHHVFMVCISWIIVRWIPSGSAFAPCMINAVIHAVIYAYFFLVIFLPRTVKLFIKTAFSCFMVIQHLGSIVFGLIVIWVRCPSTLLFAYSILILLIGIMIYRLKIYFFDYKRYGYQGEGFVSYSMNIPYEKYYA